jgi:shikimate kinase
MQALKSNGGVCVLLHASFHEIIRRVGNTNDRPLLHDHAKAEALYNSRQSLYRSYAEITVNTEQRSVAEVCDEIIRQLP